MGADQDKLAAFRIQKTEQAPTKRFPLGQFPFRVDIGFGSSTMTRDGALRINTVEAVRKSASKPTCKAIWATNNIPQVSKFKGLKEFVTTSTSGRNEFLVENFESFFSYPIVAKKNNGSKGEGMKYIKNYEELVTFLQSTRELKAYHFEEMFEFDQEFRIHVSPWLENQLITYQYTRKSGNTSEVVTKMRRNGVIFMLQKKLKQDAYDRGVRHTNRAGNYDSVVFTSKFTEQPWMEEAMANAVKAIKVLGLDFGFVDVGYNSHANKYVFFESGSNPELSTPEKTCYIQALPHIILAKGTARGKIGIHLVKQVNTAARASNAVEVAVPVRTKVNIVF